MHLPRWICLEEGDQEQCLVLGESSSLRGDQPFFPLNEEIHPITPEKGGTFSTSSCAEDALVCLMHRGVSLAPTTQDCKQQLSVPHQLKEHFTSQRFGFKLAPILLSPQIN